MQSPAREAVAPQRRIAPGWRFLTVGIAAILLIVLCGWAVRWQLYRQRWQVAIMRLEVQEYEEALRELEPCAEYWSADVHVQFQLARAARLADALERAAAALDRCDFLVGSAAGAEGSSGGITRQEIRFERDLLRAQLGDVRPLFTAVPEARQVVQELVPQLAASPTLDAPAPATPQEAGAALDDDRIQMAWDALAQGWLALQKPDLAVRFCEQLLRRNPRHVRALVLRGRLFQRQHSWEDALACFEQAQLQSPTTWSPAIFRAETLATLGYTRPAIQQYEVLRRSWPEEPRVLLGLARCRIDLNQLDAADEFLQAVLERNRRHLDALVLRAQWHWHRQELAEAAAAAKRALEVVPQDPTAASLLVRSLAAAGDDQGAATARQQQRDWETNYGRVANQLQTGTSLMVVADQLAGLGRSEDATVWYHLALIRETDLPKICQALARIHAGKQQPHLASLYERIAQASGGSL